MRFVIAVGVALVVLVPLAAMAARGPREAGRRPGGRVILEGLAVLAAFVLVVVVVVALRS
jgi:hypothetical protein